MGSIPIRSIMTDDEDMLGLLAMKFRGSHNINEKNEAVRDYEQAVNRLVNSGKWKEMPALEDMLPHNLMPQIFFQYWGLRK